MSAYGELDAGLQGNQQGLDNFIESVVAQEAIFPGKPVMGFLGEENNGYNIHLDTHTLLGDADFVASNSIAVTVIPQGSLPIAVTPVVFTVDQATTRLAVVNAINANAALAALKITAAIGTGTRDIVITTKGQDITATIVVTLGASQAIFADTASIVAKFMGVAIQQALGYKDSTGSYPKTQPVPILTHGRILVPVSVAVQDKQPAYFITAVGATQGQFTNSNSGTYDIGGFFRSNRNAVNLAELEVRGLK